jgi:hypothetical protein
MTTLIEAAKQALEALETIVDAIYVNSQQEANAVIKSDKAITALRTAIEAAEKQEPVAQIIALGQYEFPGLEWLSADHSFRAPIGTLLYTTPPAAPVQGQTVYSGDEPAWNDQFEAWWENHGQLCRAGGGDYEKTFAFRAYEAALTTPPAQPAQEPSSWVETVAVNLVREGINKHKARELSAHFHGLAQQPAAQPAPVEPVACVACEGNPKWGNIPCAVCGTTPSAAQPAVPDAFGTREGEHPQYIQGWNDCRAEMLRGMKP